MKSINKFIGMACVSALLFSCSEKKDNAAEQKEELPLVSIEKVMEEDVPQIVSYTATVERPWFSAEALVWILCIAVGVVLLVVYVILFIRGRRKRKA